MLAGREAVIEALLVVDGEGRRLFAIEGRKSLPLATGALQGHAARHHLRHRQAGPDLIQERIGELHSGNIERSWGAARWRFALITIIHRLRTNMELSLAVKSKRPPGGQGGRLSSDLP